MRTRQFLTATWGGLRLAALVAFGLALVSRPGRAQTPAPVRDLTFYLSQAQQNSPLSHEVRNQSRAAQLETERLRAFYTKATGTLVGNYTAVPVLTRDNGRTQLSYSADAASGNYVGYDVALSNGALYQGYAQLTQPLFNHKRYEAFAQQAQGVALSQQNLVRLSLHDLEKLVGDQYILCRQDLDQLSYVRELLGILDKQRLLVRKLAAASLLKQSDYLLLNIEVETQQVFLNTYRAAYHRDLLNLNVLCGLGDTTEVQLAPPNLPLRRTGPPVGLSGFTERQRIEATEPALTVDFGQRIADLLGDLMSSSKPIEIKLFGDDQATLEKLSAQIGQVLGKVSGVADVNDGLVAAGPSIVFRPDIAKLALYGLTPLDFQAQLSNLVGGQVLSNGPAQVSVSPAQAGSLGGIQVGQIQDGEQMRQVLLRYVDFGQNSLAQLRRQVIALPNGSVRPLPFFASIDVQPGNVELRREDLKSVALITARLDGRDLGSTIQAIRQRVGRQVALPPGYTIVYGGAYAEQQASFRELLLILLTACLLVFAVLLFLFREWLISVLVLFISVMGITGCVLGLFFVGIPLNVSSYTGIIMIVGIIAENAIFTVHQFYDSLRETGDVDTAIRYAIALRIRPKLMTAIGAILALSPLALGIGLGAQMQQPLAVAVIGGFVVALPMLLFVLPTGMRLIYHRRSAAQELAERG